MKAKFLYPYLLSAGMLLSYNLSEGQTEAFDGPIPFNKHKTNLPVTNAKALADATFSPFADANYSTAQMEQDFFDAKASELRDKYVENMVTSQQKLGPLVGKSGYRNAVRRELPGAPVGMHCVYGQYTHLSRALQELGDTLTIIPKDGGRSCVNFKAQMRQKYNSPEFEGCLHEGKMYQSDSLYQVALQGFLTRNHVTSKTSDEVRAKLEKEFAKKNFSVESLEPGTMLVVPRRRGSRSQFHMIMFLGRGKVENGRFVPDQNGKYIYTGHNRETIGDLFKTWDTSLVFAADTKKITSILYAKEWESIKSMDNNGLIHFISDGNVDKTAKLQKASRGILLKLAHEKYFKTQESTVPIRPEKKSFAYVPQMYQNMMQRTI